jgi:regulator of protease activity HflC (stomatin/prohibitin superfamily)
VNAAKGRAEALVLDAKAQQEALLLASEAQAQQQKVLAIARAEAAAELARVIEAHPAAAEGLRLLLAMDWTSMGKEMAKTPGGSVLMVDPQSPASLLTAIRGLQEKG